MNDSTNLFWTEGTIDAIAIDGNDAAIRFRLVPTSSFLVETESGKRMLFKKEKPDEKAKNQYGTESPTGIQNKELPLDAKLVRCVKERDDGKEGQWFRWFEHFPTQSGEKGVGIRRITLAILSAFGPGLLLEAKKERTTVRLGVPASEFDVDSSRQPPPPPYTISVLMFV